MNKETKLNLYETEIVKEYNGSKIEDENALVAKITGENETFHLFILPNYTEKWVRFGCDSNTDFAQQVTQLMMDSGEAEHLIKQVYDRCFNKPEEPISVENGYTTYKSSFDAFL
jgi:hypothetical protein